MLYSDTKANGLYGAIPRAAAGVVLSVSGAQPAAAAAVRGIVFYCCCVAKIVFLLH